MHLFWQQQTLIYKQKGLSTFCYELIYEWINELHGRFVEMLSHLKRTASIFCWLCGVKLFSRYLPKTWKVTMSWFRTTGAASMSASAMFKICCSLFHISSFYSRGEFFQDCMIWIILCLDKLLQFLKSSTFENFTI